MVFYTIIVHFQLSRCTHSVEHMHTSHDIYIYIYTLYTSAHARFDWACACFIWACAYYIWACAHTRWAYTRFQVDQSYFKIQSLSFNIHGYQNNLQFFWCSHAFRCVYVRLTPTHQHVHAEVKHAHTSVERVHTLSWAYARLPVSMCMVNTYTSARARFSWACGRLNLACAHFSWAWAHFQLSMCTLPVEHVHKFSWAYAHFTSTHHIYIYINKHLPQIITII